MKLKRKLIYTINKVYYSVIKLPQYLKKIIVRLSPISARQRIREKRVVKFLNVKIFGASRSPRVYVKKGISRMQFFEILNMRKIEYVLLRWWEDLPEMPPGEDMDILIKDEHRGLLDDLITYHDNGTGMKADIYTISGTKNGSHRSIPYFQANLAHTLINTRVLFKGAYVPAPIPYFASLAYHALFHKGYNSGLPGFGIKCSTDIEHDYLAILKGMALKVGIAVDITASELYEWLQKKGFAPANDTLTKLIENLPELSVLEVPLVCDARGGELLTFVIRETLLKDRLLNEFIAFLERRHQFDIIDVRKLNPEEQKICTLNIRGGKWDKGPFRYSGGSPGALIVAYDYHPRPLGSVQQMKQLRMTNKNNFDAKYVFRESMESLVLIKGNYNGVHSADNEPDAWSYISLVGEQYRLKMATEAERRRARYAAKWGVKKLLSSGPESKTELISYECGVVLKKTFRVDKERFFDRELFAAKELSSEMSFIPPLLEVGEGYVVIPYLENVLDTLSHKEKKHLLSSKKNEILNVIRQMYSRGFAYINFTPENIIVTPKNEFYCRNFEFLHKYEERPAKFEDAYEIAGLPPDFKGDYPEFFLRSSSFNKVWKPYLGSWGN